MKGLVLTTTSPSDKQTLSPVLIWGFLFFTKMLGKGIKYYRHQKAITQKELAKMCGISNNTMCSIESNITMANKTSVAQICKHLGVTVEQLMYKSIPENILKKLIYDESK